MLENIGFLNGGKFISRGRGRHPARTLDSNELIFVVSGRLNICEAGRRFTVLPGEFLFLDAGLRHAGSADYPPDLAFFWGHFTGERPGGCPKYGPAARRERFADYFALLLSEQRHPDHAAVCGLLWRILLLETTRSTAETEAGVAIRRAETAHRILELRYCDNLSTAAIARELHCHADYLGREFRRRYGCSVIAMLNEIRLEHAARELRDGTGSIKEAAFANGFNDIAYFRRQFKRRFSLTPSEYRAIHAPGHINTL